MVSNWGGGNVACLVRVKLYELQEKGGGEIGVSRRALRRAEGGEEDYAKVARDGWGD